MNKFNTSQIYECDHGIRVAIVSKRLANLILKKSEVGDWGVYYFNLPYGEYMVDRTGAYIAVAINTDGLVLCVAPGKGEII